MGGNKTRPETADAGDFLAAIEDGRRRADCRALLGIMERVTGQPPVMWGASMVGFDRYRYRYESGREGEWFVTGFSPRKNDISVYLLTPGPEQDALLARLGRHKMAKSCLSIRHLADVDLAVLEALVAGSVRETRRLHGAAPDAAG